MNKLNENTVVNKPGLQGTQHYHGRGLINTPHYKQSSYYKEEDYLRLLLIEKVKKEEHDLLEYSEIL